MTKINKEGWEIKKLGDLYEITSSKRVFQSEWRESGVPFYRAREIVKLVSQGYVDNELFIDEELFERYSTSFGKPKPGDLMVTAVGTLGVCYLVKANDRFYFKDGNIIWLKDKGFAESKFVSYYFKAPSTIAEINKCNGATVGTLTIVRAKELNIPLPPLHIQQRIVEELDEINAIISAKKQQLSKLDELAQSIFYNMFGDPITNEKGWEVKTMEEIGSIERGAGISKKDFVNEGLPCIHYGQLHTVLGPTTHTHLTCIPKDLLPKYKYAHPNDVVMAITSEDVEGSCKSTAWLGDYDVVVGSDAAVFHHNQNGVYVSYYTQTKAFYNEKAKYAKGFKVTHISAKEIAVIPIPLPPLPLQEAFAACVSAIEEQKSSITASIEKMQTLLDARMQEYFG